MRNSKAKSIRAFFWVFILVTVLSGCSMNTRKANPESLAFQPFIAPTLVPTPLPTLTPLPTSPAEENPIGNEQTNSNGETVEQDCSDQLTFVDDLTIPDGTVVAAGSTLDKQWEVENSGSCNWGEGYQIRLISGDSMSADPEQSLIPARSGSRVTIRVVFTAPDEPGDYRSAWQAFNPDGTAFGDPFYIDISVE